MYFIKRIIAYFLPGKIINFLDKYQVPFLRNTSLYNFIISYLEELSKAEISRRAMAISYSLFMSFFPFILFFFSLIAYLPYNKIIADYIHEGILQIFPFEAEQFVWNTIKELIPSKKRSILSWSFILLIFLSTNGVYSFIESFRKMDLVQKSSFFKDYIKSFFLTLFLSFLLLLALVLIYYNQVIFRFFIQLTSQKILNIISYLSIWAAFFIGINTLYLIGSNHVNLKNWKKKLPGAIFTTILFIVSSFLFGAYIRNFSRMNLLYGSMRTALIIMFWLYINNALILAGYKLNVTIELMREKIEN